MRDFDEAVTRVTFGFPSVDAYYAASSSRNVISDVKTPLLVVQARDDPIAVSSATPRDAIAARDAVASLDAAATPASGDVSTGDVAEKNETETEETEETRETNERSGTLSDEKDENAKKQI